MGSRLEASISPPDVDGCAHVNEVKQLTDVHVQHAHATQADGGAGLHPMGPGCAMDTEFTATIAMEGQIAITDWTRWAAELLARSRFF